MWRLAIDVLRRPRWQTALTPMWFSSLIRSGLFPPAIGLLFGGIMAVAPAAQDVDRREIWLQPVSRTDILRAHIIIAAVLGLCTGAGAAAWNWGWHHAAGEWPSFDVVAGTALWCALFAVAYVTMAPLNRLLKRFRYRWFIDLFPIGLPVVFSRYISLSVFHWNAVSGLLAGGEIAVAAFVFAQDVPAVPRTFVRRVSMHTSIPANAIELSESILDRKAVAAVKRVRAGAGTTRVLVAQAAKGTLQFLAVLATGMLAYMVLWGGWHGDTFADPLTIAGLVPFKAGRYFTPMGSILIACGCFWGRADRTTTLRTFRAQPIVPAQLVALTTALTIVQSLTVWTVALAATWIITGSAVQDPVTLPLGLMFAIVVTVVRLAGGGIVTPLLLLGSLFLADIRPLPITWLHCAATFAAAIAVQWWMFTQSSFPYRVRAESRSV